MHRLFYLFVCLSSAAQADISINNEQLSINSGLYTIPQDLGQTAGNNLFHSFERFNLEQGEIAQFSGTNSIQNIIARVTGGKPSLINGTLRSTIPNANFYLLNPYGIVFGDSAQLDLQGSFHASTADYVKLVDGGKFHARFPEQDILTTAPIKSFGFLGHSTATISLQNSHLVVPTGEFLSLVGGDIHISGKSAALFDEKHFTALSASTELKAGHINIISVASQAEVMLEDAGLSTGAKGGIVNLDNTLIDASGKGAGAISIWGGRLVTSDTTIQSNTLADQDGLTIDMHFSESIDMYSHTTQQILIAKTFGSGKGAEVNIDTPLFNLSNAVINLSSLSNGNAGLLNIKTTQMTLDAAHIRSGALGQGKSSDYDIAADESLFLIGQNNKTIKNDGIEQPNPPSQITTNSYVSGASGSITINTKHLNIEGGVIAVTSFSQQASGNISIQANNIDISQGGLLASSSIGKGDAGNMMITVQDTLSLTGRRDGVYSIYKGMKFKNNRSAISNLAFRGNGGNTTISASAIKLEEGGIGASSFGEGKKTGIINIDSESLDISQGGEINNGNRALRVQGFVTGASEGNLIKIHSKAIKIIGTDSGIFSETHSSKKGGNIEIQAQDIVLQDNSVISALSASTGEAGQIQIDTDNIYIGSNSKISTDA
ncbi:filamentous hemagglutinin N-terminal domain-containing protein [Candidatus Albibeggiatoa sp. nov. NOAA]|uniref:two-partner secretion domain-containing protein n=1 Tax=Candidatus Albibeggiatoa sp. nov. NOAA TaxID=3162724 RepID=UPI003302F97E|nr:filamentous hemagglutinin N-terminal domain-containing protein [Thiotrichaceae bacterium]